MWLNTLLCSDLFVISLLISLCFFWDPPLWMILGVSHHRGRVLHLVPELEAQLTSRPPAPDFALPEHLLGSLQGLPLPMFDMQRWPICEKE